MKETNLEKITPEMVLEDMKKIGEIDEETYTEMKWIFEDIEDSGTFNEYQIYEKG